MKCRNIWAIIMIGFVGLVLLGSCASDNHGGGGGGSDGSANSFQIQVTPSGVNFFPSNMAGADSKVAYPGVDAYLINHRFMVTGVKVSPDGTQVSFNILSQTVDEADRVWIKMTVIGAQLMNDHALQNAAGEYILVLGPVSMFSNIPITLNMSFLNEAEYTIEFDFVEVKDRIVFFSDRGEQLNSFSTEIFTVDRDGNDLYQVTRGATDYSREPSWSPGGEWIVFERGMPVTCDSQDLLRGQIYRVHPDGSNLTLISKAFFAGYPQVSPSGDLVAYQCQVDCHDIVQKVNICIYDTINQTQKIIFPGTGYRDNQVKVPRWSPDGKIMLMLADSPNMESPDPYPNMCTPTTPFNLAQWLYARIDPVTGDPLGPPSILHKQGSYQENGETYKLVIRNWAWAPDSKHLLMYHKRHQAIFSANCWKWKLVSKSLAITDFEAIIAEPTISGIPDQDIVVVVDIPEGREDNKASYPQVDQDGNRVWFDLYFDGNHTDIMYVDLENYAPIIADPVANDIEEVPFIADGFYNRMPNPFPPIIPEFFPLIP